MRRRSFPPLDSIPKGTTRFKSARQCPIASSPFWRRKGTTCNGQRRSQVKRTRFSSIQKLVSCRPPQANRQITGSYYSDPPVLAATHRLDVRRVEFCRPVVTAEVLKRSGARPE